MKIEYRYTHPDFISFLESYLTTADSELKVEWESSGHPNLPDYYDIYYYEPIKARNWPEWLFPSRKIVARFRPPNHLTFFQYVLLRYVEPCLKAIEAYEKLPFAHQIKVSLPWQKEFPHSISRFF